MMIGARCPSSQSIMMRIIARVGAERNMLTMGDITLWIGLKSPPSAAMMKAMTKDKRKLATVRSTVQPTDVQNDLPLNKPKNSTTTLSGVYEAKYNGAVEEITPARIPDELRDRIQKLTAAIYNIVGCSGIIRNDYIITSGNKINLLEINTIPGMTETSFIPQQIRAAGMTVKDVLTEIIENSFNQ